MTDEIRYERDKIEILRTISYLKDEGEIKDNKQLSSTVLGYVMNGYIRNKQQLEDILSNIIDVEIIQKNERISPSKEQVSALHQEIGSFLSAFRGVYQKKMSYMENNSLITMCDVAKIIQNLEKEYNLSSKDFDLYYKCEVIDFIKYRNEKLNSAKH